MATKKKPEPKPADKPAPAPKPAPARAPAARTPPAAAAKPAPRPAAKPAASDAKKPAAGDAKKPAAKDAKKPAAGDAKKPAAKDAKKPAAKKDDKKPVASAASGGGAIDLGLTGGTLQQEIEVLRGQQGSLVLASTWQDANPPKLAGEYGLALQSVEVGNNLRLAGKTLADGLAKAAKTAAGIVTLVKDHKPPTYKEKK